MDHSEPSRTAFFFLLHGSSLILNKLAMVSFNIESTSLQNGLNSLLLMGDLNLQSFTKLEWFFFYFLFLLVCIILGIKIMYKINI